jgi:alpha-tubulin suppressor-like RCC1 family protein
MAWGDNSAGELGIGSHGNQFDVPQPVKDLTGVTAIAPGTQHVLALLRSGGVLAWGANVAGDLGTGEHGAPSSDVPVHVDIITNAVGIAAGESHSVAVLANGTVMSWGENQFGQLGIADRNFLASDDPIQAFGIHNAVAVSAGAFFTVVKLADGTMWTAPRSVDTF